MRGPVAVVTSAWMFALPVVSPLTNKPARLRWQSLKTASAVSAVPICVRPEQSTTEIITR